MRGLERLVVVVPARDEAPTVERCVTSLRVAARDCPLPVRIVVVADACRDDTAGIAAAAGADVVASLAGCVGAARAAGVDEALAGLAPGDLPSTWIACTDADSTVPRDWLEHHRARADEGVDLLLGAVRLAAPPSAHVRWRARYAAGTRGSGHRHVHGANLGVRASTYRRAGGFPPSATHEDRELAERVRALPGVRVLSSWAAPVLTSDRRVGRAPGGVAGDLSA